MALATQTAPQARLGAPIYETDHKPLTVVGIRAANTLPLDAGESIDMCKVPKGARIIDAGIICSKAGTTTDADLGLYDVTDQSTYHADADGLIDGANLNTGILNRSGADVTTEIQLGLLLTDDCYVRLTINTGNLGDDVAVYVFVTYFMP
jgi:hypothetical protein